MNDIPQPPVGRGRGLILLTVILLIAAVVRLWNISDRPFWLDEFLTIEASNSQIYAHSDLPNGVVIEQAPDYLSLSKAPPWYHIWTRARAEVHPPLFYLVLRIWRTFTSDTEGWIRLLSVLLELVAIGMLYLTVKTQAGETPALWAALLMSLAGVQIDYSQECRSYTMLLACLLTASAGLVRIERYGFSPGRGVMLGIGVLAAALTHYLALPILAIFALYALIRLKGRDLRQTIISVVIAAAVFGLLWGPFAIHQRHGFVGKIWFTKDSVWSIWTWMQQLADLPARFFVTVPERFRWLLLPGALLYVLPLIFLRRHPALLLWTMVLIIGTSVDAISDLFRSAKMLNFARYTMPISPAVYAIAGLLLIHLPGWKKHLLPAALTVACIVALPGAYSRVKGDWPGMAKHISSNITSNDILLMYDYDPDGDWRIRCDLVSIGYYLRPIPPAVIFINSPPSAEVQTRIRAARTVWFFTSNEDGRIDTIFPLAKATPALSLPKVGRLEKIELN